MPSFLRMTNCTAATVRAMLAYANVTPLLQAPPALIECLQDCLNDLHGSRSVTIGCESKSVLEALARLARGIETSMRLFCNLGTGIATDLRAILYYIDPEGGPRIAYDCDALADDLVEAVSQAVGQAQGDIPVSIDFGDNELLERQFEGVVGNIVDIMSFIGREAA